MGVMAIPAKKGQIRQIHVADGSLVTVQLVGDEFCHYWVADNGDAYQENNDGTFVRVDASALQRKTAPRRAKGLAARQRRMRANTNARKIVFTGEHRGLIILVEFSDKKFKEAHTPALYEQIANTRNFTHSAGFHGSISDYFAEQSRGKFQLTFDIVGPIALPNPYSYYGRDSGGEGNDAHSGEMVAEAIKGALAAQDLDLSKYDWNGDGAVDQVYVLYAGYGQAAGGAATTIWPHEFQLQYSDYGATYSAGNYLFDTYACGPELSSTSGSPSGIDGIGTICHEFSHCLGFPDMYDTDYKNYGMACWDLMDQGSYNGGGFQPSVYTGYERMVAGWIDPVVLSKDTTIASAAPISDGGDTYIIYNDGNHDEYYMLDNRQAVRGDEAIPATGMLVYHVDYDATLWDYNEVNTLNGYGRNNHQRCTPILADNSPAVYAESSFVTDIFPYRGNDSITATSLPRASVYNKNTDGSYLMHKSILGITPNGDNTMSFRFRVDAVNEENNVNNDTTVIDVSNAAFYESFNQCAGKGANDGLWSGTIANAKFTPDISGWTSESSFGADRCARFGTSTKPANVTSPAFTLDGEATLTFRAAPWGSDPNTLTLRISDGGKIAGDSVFTMTKNAFTEFTTTLTGTGAVSLNFSAAKRFFLDEVVVRSVQATGIVELQHAPLSSDKIYSIDGRYMGTRFSSLGKGIYIINGKKIIR